LILADQRKPRTIHKTRRDSYPFLLSKSTGAQVTRAFDVAAPGRTEHSLIHMGAGRNRLKASCLPHCGISSYAVVSAIHCFYKWLKNPEGGSQTLFTEFLEQGVRLLWM